MDINYNLVTWSDWSMALKATDANLTLYSGSINIDIFLYGREY